MSTLEAEIMMEIQRLDDTQKQRVLNFIYQLESQPRPSLSALELMKLPFEERNRLAIEALKQTSEDDIELFEAYEVLEG